MTLLGFAGSFRADAPPAAMRERVGVVEDEVLTDARGGAFEGDEVVERGDVLLMADVADDTDLARTASPGLAFRSGGGGDRDIVVDTRRLTLVPALDTLLTVLVSNSSSLTLPSGESPSSGSRRCSHSVEPR